MDSIMGNNTWVLADLPPGFKPLGCKWIFKRKLKVDGTIKKFKARLVIQGFRQKSGIDYFDTYAPVARISTIRLLIAMASIHNLIIHQMDVKTAFLNGELDAEVYMNQTQGFIMPGNENKVCKLIKSLYALMQDMGEADVILGLRIKHEMNFVILEDLGSVIDGRISEAVLGKPFVQASKLTYDESLGLIRLYLTRRSLKVLRKFHWTTLGGRSNQLSHVSSPLLSKPGEYWFLLLVFFFLYSFLLVTNCGFVGWLDPPMYDRVVDAIPDLLRVRNELEDDLKNRILMLGERERNWGRVSGC
nr:zinc finger, CCHC-type [Tanacetum cinerariifolium]